MEELLSKEWDTAAARTQLEADEEAALLAAAEAEVVGAQATLDQVRVIFEPAGPAPP